MATEEKESTPSEAAPKKKLPIATILILLQSLATLGAAGFAIWAVSHPPKPPVSIEQLKERTILSIEDREADIKNVDLEEFQVNAKSGGTLRAKIVLEVSNSEVENAVKRKLPNIKDLVSSMLTQVEQKDIRDIQGKLSVKNNLRNALNDMVIPMIGQKNTGLVREVYVVELLANQ